jgi:hypothetical protein
MSDTSSLPPSPPPPPYCLTEPPVYYSLLYSHTEYVEDIPWESQFRLFCALEQPPSDAGSSSEGPNATISSREIPTTTPQFRPSFLSVSLGNATGKYHLSKEGTVETAILVLAGIFFAPTICLLPTIMLFDMSIQRPIFYAKAPCIAILFLSTLAFVSILCSLTSESSNADVCADQAIDVG